MPMESSSKQLTSSFLVEAKMYQKVEMVRPFLLKLSGDFEALDIRIAGRYEEMKNESSLDPKLSMKYQFNESLS